MKKALSSLTLAAITGLSSAHAIDTETLGFEFGANIYVPAEARLSGQGYNMSLVIPVNSNVEGIVYHEQGNYTGEDGNDFAKVDLDLTEIRIQLRLPVGEQFGVDFFGGLGLAQLTDQDNANNDDSALVADIGANLELIKSNGKMVNTSVGLSALFRYLDLNEEWNNLGGAATGFDNVESFGGIVFGVNIEMMF